MFDQNACSSPHLILWRGTEKQIDAAMTRFWSQMECLFLSKDPPPVIHALDKYAHLCRICLTLDSCGTVCRHQNFIYRMRLKNIPKCIERYRGKYGFFFEVIDNDFSELKSCVDERYQTVTFFGVDSEEITDLIIDHGLTGIDRVVPVGKALDIGKIWDGYDLMSILSRVISTTGR